MMDDSQLTYPLDKNPLPTLVLEATSDRIFDCNPQARALFGTDLHNRPLRAFLKTLPTAMAVFLEAVVHFGNYIDSTLQFGDASGKPLRLQTFGTHVTIEKGIGILLSFLDLEAQEWRDHLARKDSDQRAGLMEWNRIYGFFRELEAQNQLILEAAGEGIYGINTEGKATFINPAALDVLGWSEDELIGRNLHSIIHHRHLDGAVFPAKTCPIYNSFRNDETVRVENDVFWRKDGKPVMVEYVSTPIYDKGVLAGAVVIFHDITERTENEHKLRSAMAEIEALKLKLEQENDYLLTEIRSARAHTGIVGRSPAIQSLNRQIDLVADTDTNVLVTGATGTGKSLTVSAIHEASARSKRPLVKVNCSNASAEELEAELFGYRKGAFRGATRDTVGKLALAQRGSLHLEEVGDLPKRVQAKLMEVIRTGQFYRLGDTVGTPNRLTILSTTSTDLQEEVNAGRFRSDLYFALAVFPIRCTPLRNRAEDIPYLAKHFLAATSRRLRRPASTLSKANIQTLLDYPWPGNIRELENAVERATILANGGKLNSDFLSGEDQVADKEERIHTVSDLKEHERKNLIACLRRSGGKVAGHRGAADLLGTAPTTVHSRIKALNITKADWEF